MYSVGDLVTFIPYSESDSNDNKFKDRLGIIIKINDNNKYCKFGVKWIDYEDDVRFLYEASELKKL